MKLPHFLETDAHGLILLSGHRVGLHDVLCFYREGYSPEMILGEFPTLSLALIHRTIVFYLENRQEVDEYLRQEREQVAKQRVQATSGPDLKELRERMKAMHHGRAPTIAYWGRTPFTRRVLRAPDALIERSGGVPRIRGLRK